MSKTDVRVFIASSRHAKAHAQKLATRLNKYPHETYKINTNTWWCPDTPLGGLLDDLLSQTTKSDFAIVLLTSKLTELVHDCERERENQKIRYNSIYEAGLFTGGLGADKNRVFIVYSGNFESLPSDLFGIKCIHFDEDKSGADLKQHLEEIADEIAERICSFDVEGIHPLVGFRRPMISKEDLFNRETLVPVGKLAWEGTLVFVNTPEPMEVDEPLFATRVVENVLINSIKYIYVFEGKKAHIDTMGRLIGKIVSAAIQNNQRHLSFTEKLTLLARNIQIYFVIENPGFEYCIHNAESKNEALCYLRYRSPYPDDGQQRRWIVWAEGERAMSIATEIQRITSEVHRLQERIFHDTNICPINECDCEHPSEGLRIPLTVSIREGLKALARAGTLDSGSFAEVLKACFGEPATNHRTPT